MSGYGKMQASPFWRKVMGVTAIFFVITLVTPTAYYIKYILIDRPLESRAAQSPPSGSSSLSNVRVVDVEYYTNLTHNPDPKTRISGVQALGAMVLLPGAQMKYPIECLHAKLAVESALESDPDQTVHAAAMQTLLQIASHGAVIKR